MGTIKQLEIVFCVVHNVLPCFQLMTDALITKSINDPIQIRTSEVIPVGGAP